MEPSARVEKPVIPWPTVQPMATTPPKPISAAPIRWLAVSSTLAKPSQRKPLVRIDQAKEPAMTPSTVAMAKVTVRLVSDHSISNSSV